MANSRATVFYGLISGRQSDAFASGINKTMETSMVVSTWENINEFQKYVGGNAKEEIKGVTAILITDYAFDQSMDVKAKAFAFTFMQSMFKEKDLYGLHIILYSKDENLIAELNEMYINDKDLKYEGTRILHCGDNYSVTNIRKVFESPFSLLSYSDKKKREIEEMEKQSKEKMERMTSQRGFMMLLGKQQALQDMLDITNRELTVVNRKIIEYATAINNENFDSIIDDIEGDISEDIKEQYEKLR